DVAQVLDRAGTQQGFPRVGTGGRPVGDVQREVVIRLAGALDIETVAREHRETQVVADQRADPPALPVHRQPVTTGCIALVLAGEDRKSTRLNSSHVKISYAVFCLKKKII